MDLLLKRGRQGNVLQGSARHLQERAAIGDDLTLYIESLGYDEIIIFGNYAVSQDRVSALSLTHLNHGDLADPTVLDREPIATVQYIYDSQTNNVLIKDFLDEGRTLTTVFSGNRTYKSYAWYTTRRFVEVVVRDSKELTGFGDQFKVRMEIDDGFRLIIKPDIVYFPHRGKDYLIKSSSMLLPSEFVADPAAYLASGRSLSVSSTYSAAYFNIDSDDAVTIVGKRRFVADKSAVLHVSEGEVGREDESPTRVTRIRCAHAILAPDQ
jgi:hypothetical protein